MSIVQVHRYVFTFLIAIGYAFADACVGAGTSIEAIQGQGDESSYKGRSVTTSGIVTAVLNTPDAQSGFFIQEEDADPKASHGLYVYSKSPVKTGEALKINGKVKEFYRLTELVDVSIVGRCGQNPVPAPKLISYELTDKQKEALEGVLVQLPAGYLSATGELLSYGQTEVSGTWPTVTGSVTWSIDDGSSNSKPNYIPYLAELTNLNQLSLGARSQPITAIVNYSFNRYRLIPTVPVKLDTFATDLFKQPADLRLASVNAQNLFNGDGSGQRFLKNRGAKNESDYRQQLGFLSQGLAALNSDVLVLNEVESDGFSKKSTVADLVAALSTSTASQYKPVVFTPSQLGEGAIQNVLLFNHERLELTGSAQSIIGFEGWEDRWHRPFIAQTFVDKTTGKPFVVIGTHLKSKAGKCPGDTKVMIQQFGACSRQRADAITLLNRWVDSWQVDVPVFLMGDLNAHPGETAVDSLLTKNWQTPFNLDEVYSYVFKGEPNLLDYIFIKHAPEDIVSHQGYWNVNAGQFPLLKKLRSHPQLGQLKQLKTVPFSDHDPVFIDVRWPETQ